MTTVPHAAGRRSVTIEFEEGLTFVVPSSWRDGQADKVTHLDSADGNPFHSEDGIDWGLTLCCGATHKGMDYGIGCRSCYRITDDTNDTPMGHLVARLDPKDPA